MTVLAHAVSGFDVLLRGEPLVSLAERLGRRTDPARRRLRILRDWKAVHEQAGRGLYVVMFLKSLLNQDELREARAAKSAGPKRFLLLPDKAPPEALVEMVLKLDIRSPERVHTPRLQADDARSFVLRFLSALQVWPDQELITDAWWEADHLVVLSPTFRRLRVPAEAMPRMRGASAKQREAFEIDGQGEFVFWPALDLHMDWPAFEQAVDPQAKLRACQKSEAFNARYGEAIRALREHAALRQSDVPGLDERTVRRIEQGRTRATAGALRKLAAAHHMDVNAYLAAVAGKLGRRPSRTEATGNSP